MAAVYESEVKLFGKWSYDELVCEDISLTVRLVAALWGCWRAPSRWRVRVRAGR